MFNRMLSFLLERYKACTHKCEVIDSAMASQIVGVSIACPAVCSGTDQRKHQSSALLAFVSGIHLSPVDSPQRGPVTRKMFPCDDVIMRCIFPCSASTGLRCRRRWILVHLTPPTVSPPETYSSTISGTRTKIPKVICLISKDSIVLSTRRVLFFQQKWLSQCVRVEEGGGSQYKHIILPVRGFWL